MLKAMEEYFPEGVTWTHPEGGLFTWVTLPDYMNAKDLQMKCLGTNATFLSKHFICRSFAFM